MDRRFVITAFAYAILGLMLGLYMAGSHDHGQMVTHAHIMMIGFLVSFSYGLCHKLWLNAPNPMLSKLQFYVHQVGTLGVVTGLFLLYGNRIAIERVDPFLALASFLVFFGVVLMTVLIIKSKPIV